MELTVAQKNELATRLVNAQQTNNYGSFNDLVKQLRLTQADLLSNFPAINQAGINEQISRGAVVPTTAPAATTFTSGQVSSAIRDALNAGFTVQQARQGAMTNFGLSSEEFDKALKSVQSSTYNTTFSDDRVAQAIRDSLAQGFTLEQARQGAMANYGVSDAQFNRAASMVSGAPQAMRGSAPVYQFPGLLAGREDMGTGAQRFIARAPGSLLFDVPKVEGGQFTFTPGAFDYQAIREQQAGASKVDQAYLDQNQIQPGTSEYNRLTGKTTPQSSTTTTTTPTTTTTTTPVTTTTTTPTTTTIPTTTTTPSASSQYTDAQVAQAIKESMAQGFSLVDSMAGATRVFGVPAEQVYRAADTLLAPKKMPGLLSNELEGEQKRQIASVAPEIQSLAPTVTESVQPIYQPQITQAVESYTPTTYVAPTEVPRSYSDAQVAQAIQESMGQGFSLPDSIAGATRVFGVPVDQVYRAADSLFAQAPQVETAQFAPAVDEMIYEPQQFIPQAPAYQEESVFQSPVADGLLSVQQGFPTSQIAQAILDSLNQGFTMDQIQQGAFNNFGVDADQFSRAAAMLPSMGYSIGRGFQ